MDAKFSAPYTLARCFWFNITWDTPRIDRRLGRIIPNGQKMPLSLLFTYISYPIEVISGMTYIHF